MLTSRRTTTALGLVIAAMCLFLPRHSFANNYGISAEGVSDYSYFRSVYGAGSAGDIDMATEASGFYNTMTTTSGTPWTSGTFWTDGNVWDQDLYDPDLTGVGSDDSTSSSDDPTAGPSPNAITFLGAHGDCNDANSTTCTTSADCASGQYCAANPPSANSSRCINGSDRTWITSSSTSTHGQFADYSASSGVAFGEDSNSGGWRGGGTSGSDTVVFVVNSCGSKEPFFWGETKPDFAGAMLINYTMPQSNVSGAGAADTVTWSSRGSVLAMYALANPSASVTAAWDANLDSAPKSDGGSCPDQTGTYTYGGGYGYTGCAGNLSVGWAQNQSLANWYVQTMSWTDAQSPGLKPTGNSYGYGWIHCNYDCNTYGFYK